MITIFSNIIFVLAFSSSTAASPSAPTVRCTIVLNEWCIANSPSKVSMVDLAYRRLWLITSPTGMQHGPLVIISDKTCNESADLDVSFTNESKRKITQNGEIYEATFKLNKSGCQLKFEWPAGAADSYSYQEFMSFNVFVGKKGQDNYTPLYEIYNKTRCHGIFIQKDLECK